MSKRGILITLEGNEGCGKSTQIQLLYKGLKKRKFPVFLTREPGGTRVGDVIRKILLDPKNKKISGITETLLYMASRAQLVSEVIKPHLEKGEIVLCDRWLDATVAYQGFGAGVDVDWIRALGEEATRGIKPALSIYLDLPVIAGLRRARSHKRADRMERKNVLFHKKVRRGYLWIAKKEPRRFKRIVLKEADGVASIRGKIKRIVSNVI